MVEFESGGQGASHWYSTAVEDWRYLGEKCPDLAARSSGFCTGHTLADRLHIVMPVLRDLS